MTIWMSARNRSRATTYNATAMLSPKAMLPSPVPVVVGVSEDANETFSRRRSDLIPARPGKDIPTFGLVQFDQIVE